MINAEQIKKMYPVQKVKIKSVGKGHSHDPKVRREVLKQIREGITIGMAEEKFGIAYKTIATWIYQAQQVRKNRLKISRI